MMYSKIRQGAKLVAFISRMLFPLNPDPPVLGQLSICSFHLQLLFIQTVPCPFQPFLKSHFFNDFPNHSVRIACPDSVIVPHCNLYQPSSNTPMSTRHPFWLFSRQHSMSSHTCEEKIQPPILPLAEMYQRTGLDADPFTSPRTPQQTTARKTSYNWRSVARPSRFSGLRISPIRIVIMLAGISLFLLIRDQIPHITTLTQQQLAELARMAMSSTTSVPFAAFQPPELVGYREPDTIDTFASYKFRNTCNVSSLDLHTPFSPLCQDRASMLTAMASGGRIGLDAPYMTRGCDMRWFTSEEVCEILQRFDRVVLVGDSMLRHVIGSINILLRKDLGYGAVTDWNFSVKER